MIKLNPHQEIDGDFLWSKWKVNLFLEHNVGCDLKIK
jgi:hypothetical protein